MAKKTETAVDVRELTAKKWSGLQEAFKKVIEFEYYKCWDELQDRLSDIKKAFNADYVNELTDNMDGLQAEYFKLMDYGIMDLDLDELSCCIPCDTEKELIKRYGELEIDEKTLKMIAKMLS